MEELKRPEKRVSFMINGHSWTEYYVALDMDVWITQELAKLKSEHAEEMRKKDEEIKSCHEIIGRDLKDTMDRKDYITKLISEIFLLKAEIKQIHKDYGCELRDPCGTIWEYAEKLKEENERLKKQESEGMDATIDQMLSKDISEKWGLDEHGHKRNVQHIFMRACHAISELEDDISRLKEQSRLNLEGLKKYVRQMREWTVNPEFNGGEVVCSKNGVISAIDNQLELPPQPTEEGE